MGESDAKQENAREYLTLIEIGLYYQGSVVDCLLDDALDFRPIPNSQKQHQRQNRRAERHIERRADIEAH